MPESDRIAINASLSIPTEELTFRFSRSSGPGGQHAQRNETRVELAFDVASSPSLTDEQRSRLRMRLAGRIDTHGVLRVTCSSSRSQAQNRALALLRFQRLLAGALRRRKPRLPTMPHPLAHERRLVKKRSRSKIKRLRQKPADEDAAC